VLPPLDLQFDRLPIQSEMSLSSKRNSLRSMLYFRGTLASRNYSSLSARLHDELTTRKLPLTYDYLHPQPSHLLNLTLRDLLPQSQTSDDTTLPSIQNPSPLPAGHHLIYFPPQVTLSQLLPDCTDTLHTPGEPFNRRLWAGGNLRFPVRSPPLDGSRAVCIESIRNVTVKGREGDEKVVVTIERRIGNVPEEETTEQTWNRLWKENKDDAGESSVIENRDLIFMRLKTVAQIEADKAQFDKPSRIVKRAHIPPNLNVTSNVLIITARLKLPQTRHSAIPSYLPKRFYSGFQR
jgi:hydroxyacyl-ACP dehydratase HTD2-like protein with hotdog domain